MLADLEWQTPHWKPNGKTVAEWVEEVRWFERNNWLRDPATMVWDEVGPYNYATQYQRAGEALCLPLCWRPRCRRTGRCRHRIALAIREFMPEFGHYIARVNGEVLPNEKEVLDRGKLYVLDDVLGPLLPEGAESDNARRWAGRFMRGEI